MLSGDPLTPQHHKTRRFPMHPGCSCRVVHAFILIFLALFSTSHAGEYEVTTTGDNGAGSLRQAISDANASAGTDTITFAIPGTGPFAIQPTSQLPVITDPVVIDGYSQAGSSPATDLGPAALMIELDGSNAGSDALGLRISGGHSLVQGLCINRFEDGILLESSGENVIRGNYIGTDVTGASDRGNTGYGVYLSASPNNTIGGISPETRNIISGNDYAGVYISESSATGNLIQGNYIGTDASGTVGLGNTGAGVWIGHVPNNTIGGTSPGARNVISDNNDSGVFIHGSSATGNLVQGNYIGTDASGAADLGNTPYGVYIFDAPNNTIGGISPGARNIISGNDYSGVYIFQSSATGNLIQGNYIGTDASGTCNLGNSGSGVGFYNADNNTIGGTSDSARNTVAYNTGDGIYVDSGSNRNRLLSNSIFLNDGLGIDLGSDGVNVNDTGDPDTGANDLQNYPVLSLAGTGGLVQGTLNSLSSTTFHLQFFYSDTCDPTGYGEGQYLLGDTLITTDGSGDVPFSFIFDIVVPEDAFVTATSTDTTLGNTSEFCQAIMAEQTELILTDRISGDFLILEWNTVPPAAEYWIYGATSEPFFAPQTESPFTYRILAISDTTWITPSGIADPDNNWTYQVIAIDGSENELGRSNRVGEYEFMLP